MRAVIQRVKRASVTIDQADQPKSAIEVGLVVFLGISGEDGETDARWLAEKLPRIRCFDDGEGRMNLSLLDIGGSILLISQFTLFGTLTKGTRPSFNRAALPDKARELYQNFILLLECSLGKPVGTGEFGANMQIDALNDGPVTLILDTRQKDF